MATYTGLTGVHRPAPRLSQDEGAVVLIRVTSDGVFDPNQKLEWAVLSGPSTSSYRVGMVDNPALAQTIQDAAVERSHYILGVVTHLGAVAPLPGDGEVPEGIITTAGQAISALGWG